MSSMDESNSYSSSEYEFYESAPETVEMKEIKPHKGGAGKFEIENPLSFSWQNIRYSVSIPKEEGIKRLFNREVEEKEILKGISGECKPGELMAIMGPSGAGKTTLLDILSRRIQTSESEESIRVNGKRRGKYFSQISAYVMQEDILLGSATVKETLQLSAKLRLPSSISQKKKDELVDNLIEELELSLVAHNRIGNEFIKGISGGEMKRVAIGVEVVTNPGLIFLDEPTTGLDSSMALSVVRTLKNLAERGHTIICTIHQPRYEIFSLFDKLLLLGRGEMIYFGSPLSAVSHFDKLGFHCDALQNPPDFFLDLLKEKDEDDIEEDEFDEENRKDEEDVLTPDKRIQLLIDSYAKSKMAKELDKSLSKLKTSDATPIVTSKRKYQASMWTQLNALLLRDLRNSIRDPMIFGLQLAQYVLLGLLLGFSYFQLELKQDALFDRTSFIFWNISFMSMIAGFTYIIMFPKYRRLYVRERASNSYSSVSFTLSLSLYLLPIQIVSVMVFSVAVYFLVGFKNSAENFFIFFAFNFVVVLASEGLAVAVSALCPSTDVANLVYALFFVIWFVFTPVFVNLNTLPKWLLFIPYTSLYKWSIEGLMINELSGRIIPCDDALTIPCPVTSDVITIGDQLIPSADVPLNCTIGCPFPTGDDYLDSLNFDTTMWQDALILAGFYVFFKIIQFTVLAFVGRTKR